VALLNPKTALFFAAFLPQFMDAGVASAGRGVALGALFVAIAAGTDAVYAVAAGAVAPALRRTGRLSSFGRYASATALVGLGAWAALSGWRPGGGGHGRG
jgi:threonine/homoserine/homoserine lactone efflux protein